MMSDGPTHPKAGEEADGGHHAKPCVVVEPDSFEVEAHYYTKVLCAQLHPTVAAFARLSHKQLVSRYCHIYPTVDKSYLMEIMSYKPTFFRWAGADLFNVTEAEGGRKMIIIETNSCPSGQKSMPLMSEAKEANGYLKLIKRTFKPHLEALQAGGNMIEGALAVIYDKNEMEASGYAAVIADVFHEDVYLVEFYSDEESPRVHWTTDGIMEVNVSADAGVDEWRPIRAAFRYVTQKPWSRFPAGLTKTHVLNPIVACLAGGRNKLVAAKAYELFNAELSEHGLEIRTPETVRDLEWAEVPFTVRSFGGYAVIKVPYSNAGQGVFTITSEAELEEWISHPPDEGYTQYIVQSLVGNYNWSSTTRRGTYYHVGTIPNRKGDLFAADLRMMVHYDYKAGGYRPLATYSRRARAPLKSLLDGAMSSWDMLGTNLSIKTGTDQWTTDTGRLLLMDTRDFNKLGLGLDDLVDAYIQTVLAAVAIDKFSVALIDETTGEFNRDLFRSVNKDDVLLAEIGSHLPDELSYFPHTHRT